MAQWEQGKQRVKVPVTSLRKQPISADVLAQGEGRLGWIVEEGVNENKHGTGISVAAGTEAYSTNSLMLSLRRDSRWPSPWRGLCKRPDVTKGQADVEVQRVDWGLPWWRSGWESACQCRGHGFEPWSGKIPHAAEQLGPWATITEPARLEPVLHNKRGHDSERPAHCDEEWPRSPQLEKALAQKRRPNTAINK